MKDKGFTILEAVIEIINECPEDIKKSVTIYSLSVACDLVVQSYGSISLNQMDFALKHIDLMEIGL